MNTKKNIEEKAQNVGLTNHLSILEDELANLKRISEINNKVSTSFNKLIICSANESHIKEIAELWANLASIQQMFLSGRYDFKQEGKDWQAFVRKKLSKNQNLLLVAHDIGSYEIKGFVYLQTITLPSSDLVLKTVIEDIYTKPQYRKQSIATKLLEVAMNWACSQNIKQVEFISSSKSKDLSSLYLKIFNKLKGTLDLELVTL